MSEQRDPSSAPLPSRRSDERSGPPAPTPTGRTLDRGALERVLARAAELQASSADPGEALTEAQLVELGKEVGLSPEHIRQAIAEEQTRVVVREPEGKRSGLFGPTVAETQRVIRGTQAGVIDRLIHWMDREECLQIRRRYADRTTWEARRDFLGNVKRGFNFGGRGYALARADEVGATVVPVDEARVLVRLDATFSGARQRSATGGGVLAGAGVLGAGGIVAIAASIPGASIAVAALVGGAWMLVGGAGLAAIVRAHRSAVHRGQLALEQVLDRLEHGDDRRNPSLLDVLVGGRALR